MGTIFPPTWDPTTATKKRRKTFMEDTDAKAVQSLATAVPFQSDLQQTIVRKLNAQSSTAVLAKDLNIDHILSRIPYKSMLENLFSNVDEVVPDVPILGRAYEESFMRQPMPGERQCVMGDMCECMYIDKSAPFVGVELRLPGDPPEAPQMCVLCSRSTTQKCYYDMCFLGRPIRGVIQRYGGIFGQPGEYAAECMLVCPRTMGLASMPVPSMSHQRNRYSVVTHSGLKHLKQHRVGWEDFQPPSSMAAV
jgi:hypothetical protein